MKHKAFRLILGIFLSIAGLFIAFRGIQWSEFIQEISTVNMLWYISGMLGMIVILLIRAARWHIFLLPIGSFSTYKLYKGTIAGFFTNYVLPFRMGEIVRAYITGKFINTKGALLFPSIIVERFIDGVSFFLFVIIFSLFIELPFTDRQVLMIRVLLIATLAVFAIAFYIYYRLRNRITFTLEQKKGKIAGFLKDLHHGCLALFNIRHPFKIVFSSFAIWFVTGLTYWAGIKACHIELGIVEGFILMASAMIAIAIPAAPGFFGTFHAAIVATLVILNIDKNVAASYAVLQHFIGLIPICTIGFIYFLEANVSLKDIKSLQEKE